MDYELSLDDAAELVRTVLGVEQVTNKLIQLVRLAHERGALAVTERSAYWDMAWDQERHPDKPPVERIFESEEALSVLLEKGLVFLNSYWWEETWPKDAKAVLSINVNCNDIFAWGCADAESLKYNDLQDLYNHWVKDPTYGTAVWCCKQRKELPQRPVYDRIQKMGIWDLDSLRLEPNYYDAACKKMAAERAEKAKSENGSGAA